MQVMFAVSELLTFHSEGEILKESLAELLTYSVSVSGIIQEKKPDV